MGCNYHRLPVYNGGIFPPLGVGLVNHLSLQYIMGLNVRDGSPRRAHSVLN